MWLAELEPVEREAVRAIVNAGLPCEPVPSPRQMDTGAWMTCLACGQPRPAATLAKLEGRCASCAERLRHDE